MRPIIPILITVFLLAFGMSFVNPLIPLLLKNSATSSASIGHIQSSYFLSLMFASLLIGRLIDSIGSKKIILWGLCVYSISFFMLPLVTTSHFFYAQRVLQGVGSALLFAPTEAAINIISTPERRATNMGLYAFVFAAGFGCGPVFGAALFNINTFLPFTIASLLSLAAMLVMALFYSEKKIEIKKHASALNTYIAWLKIPLITAVVYAFIEASLTSFLSLYLDEYNIKGYTLGLVFTCFAVGGTVSPLLAGKCADKWGKQNVLQACGLGLLIIFLCCTLFKSYMAICFLTFLIGLTASALYPVALALIGDRIPPDKMGLGNASFTFFFGVGSVLGPTITGWVVEITTIDNLFYIMLCAAGLFSLLLTGGRLNSSPTADTGNN